MSVTRYEVIEASGAEELTRRVNAAIDQGLQPIGGVASRTAPGRPDTTMLAQVVIEGTPVGGGAGGEEVDLSGIEGRLDALELTVDTPETGLAAVVADHATRIEALE